jgi:PIN domain nuclease of toxin-antitoxin system
MMKTGGESLLLDTHAWIWTVDQNTSRLSPAALRSIEEALTRQAVAVSEISHWEIALKAAKKRLHIGNPRQWLRRASKAPGIGVIQVDRQTLIESALLEAEERDPADRILIATALRFDLRLVTADESILNYAQRNPRLAVLDARP